MASKVSTLVHLNRLYIAVLTPGVMSHMRSTGKGTMKLYINILQ